MKYMRRIAKALLLLLSTNLLISVGYVMRFTGKAGGALSAIALLGAYVYVNCRPLPKTSPTPRIYQLACGTELLKLFLVTLTVNMIWVISKTPFFSLGGMNLLFWIIAIVPIVVLEAILFWNGMSRVYITSIQLGIKHRVLAALCGWIPLVNIWYLTKIIRITADEVEFETQKCELDEVRKESEICATKYPILLIHGVFFRDFRYLSYWGRIPKALKRNGASIYYGQQQSAASVKVSGGELAVRIRQLVEETSCEKVNIIAHSKGGLDARSAITHEGCAPFVASLTTVNTPHRGCIFAEYLFGKIPESVRQKMAATYNGALKRLGDTEPDFIAAVTDLTEMACLARNEDTPDAPEVLYESVMSYCRTARHGKFPLNVSYPLVRHFDGQNDGLVSVDSARWGSAFTLLEPTGKRGITHGDVIDLNRENISGFDVREFYVNLTASLKQRGY